eukprot:m.19492 g.19492  ORF g.19492 m.19492 type:complete len:118 (-) comp5126_c0_seq1:76-429(-)
MENDVVDGNASVANGEEKKVEEEDSVGNNVKKGREQEGVVKTSCTNGKDDEDGDEHKANEDTIERKGDKDRNKTDDDDGHKELNNVLPNMDTTEVRPTKDKRIRKQAEIGRTKRTRS